MTKSKRIKDLKSRLRTMDRIAKANADRARQGDVMLERERAKVRELEEKLRLVREVVGCGPADVGITLVAGGGGGGGAGGSTGWGAGGCSSR